MLKIDSIEQICNGARLSDPIEHETVCEVFLSPSPA